MRNASRKLILIGPVVVVCLFTSGLCLLWSRPSQNPRLTIANFDLVTEGMTQAQVEELLGPPGDYRTGPTDFVEKRNPDVIVREVSGNIFVLDRDIARRSFVLQEGTFEQWQDDERYVRVYFFDERVADKDLLPTYKKEVSATESLRWNIERLWCRWRGNEVKRPTSKLHD